MRADRAIFTKSFGLATALRVALPELQILLERHRDLFMQNIRGFSVVRFVTVGWRQVMDGIFRLWRGAMVKTEIKTTHLIFPNSRAPGQLERLSIV